MLFHIKMIPSYFNRIRLFIFQKKSTILNDENGSGKCFQCVAFLDAILRCSLNAHILIICQLKQNLAHWKYHIDNLLENVNTKIADDDNGSEQSGSSSSIIIASIDYVLGNLLTLTAKTFDCLILQDQHLQVSAAVFMRLTEIKATCKIVICSKDLIVSMNVFDYGIIILS